MLKGFISVDMACQGIRLENNVLEIVSLGCIVLVVPPTGPASRCCESVWRLDICG